MHSNAVETFEYDSTPVHEYQQEPPGLLSVPLNRFAFRHLGPVARSLFKIICSGVICQ